MFKCKSRVSLTGFTKSKKSIVLSKLGKKTAKGGKIILASPLEQKQARYKGGDAISW